MELDLEVAMEISSQIAEQTKSSSGGSKSADGMVARRDQRRAARNAQNPQISDSDLLSTLTEDSA